MNGEETPQDEAGRRAGNGCRAMRWLACCAASAALAGSLWAALRGESCDGCRRASALLARVPLAWVGAAFYALLATAAAWGGLSRWTKAGFLAASGVHVILLALLARERVFCGTCIAVGAAALAGGVLSLAARPRAGRWAAAVFATAALATVGGSMTARFVQAQRETRLLRALQQRGATRPVEPGHVLLVVYEREGCKHCFEFDDQILPRLEAAFPGVLEVECAEADLTMEAPVIELRGKTSRLFEGLPEYEELEEAVRSMR